MSTSTLYFNHTILENESADNLKKYIKEIAFLRDLLRTEEYQLKFYEEFWNIQTQEGQLASFLYGLSDRDEVKAIITSVMEGGPYFSGSISKLSLSIQPSISLLCFGSTLMEICWMDRHNLVLSLREEKELPEVSYEISDSIDSLTVNNIIGEINFRDYLTRHQSLKDIDEVFEIIESRNPEIIILDKAKRNSKRHNFQDRYTDVLKAIMALKEIELPLLLENAIEEQRKRTFFDRTGFEISGESSQTLSIKRYREEREFVVPRKGKVIFKWHVKIGLDIRIHYFIDTSDKKVYIGHCGRHLGTYSYNS